MKGKITILVNSNYTTIEVTDPLSRVRFIEIRLTPEQLSQALSRLSETECEMNLFGLDRIGRKMEHKMFEFELPDNYKREYARVSDETLHKHAQSMLSDGWIAENYFGSKDSFFTKDGKKYARTIIRRWVDTSIEQE